MNAPSTRVLAGMAGAALALIGTLSITSLPIAAAISLLAAASVCVAFVAQSQRLRDEDRLVYRPVYVRRQDVQRRVRSDLD